MSLKEKMKAGMAGLLTCCLVLTSTPAIALSTFAASPETAYAEEAASSDSAAGNENASSNENANSEADTSTNESADANSASSGTDNSSADSNGTTPSSSDPSATVTNGKDPSNSEESTESTAENSQREPKRFDANNYIKEFKLTLESGDISKTYTLTSGQHIDITSDFPDGLSRSTTYVGVITLDVKALAEAENKYPLVPGDTLVCDFPSILRPNSTMTGRLRDASADWDNQHEGVGNYTIADGKLSISYDDGYIEEKSGKILTSSIKFSGGFDTSTQTEDQFDFNLTFGSIMIGTRFSKLEIVRNLSIEKSGTTIQDGPYFSQGTTYPLRGSADIDSDGYLTYSVKVTAGEDNTHTLTHVKVTDVFDADSQSKVDLTSMKLVSATIDGEDIAPRTVAVTDEENRVNGWDIGSLPAGVTALITFKVKLNKDGLSEAVKAEKQGSPETDAIAARTIKNTASASADSVPAVSDDYSTYVKNYVTISKGTSPYSYQNQSQNFTITVSAPSTNRYTEYNVPIFDELSNTYASLFSECGITSMTVKHSDGSQEDLTWGNFTQPNSISWRATIPEIRPGDTITIKSYAKVNDDYWNSTTDASNGSGGDTYITNYAYIGAGTYANNVRANDLNYTYDYSSFSLYKQWLTKNAPSINSDGTISWLITGNQQGKSATPANVAGQTVTDTLGPNQAFEDGQAYVTFYNQDNSIAGRDTIVLHEGDTSFSYVIPEIYGTCGFTISYKSKITDWDGYVGPAKKYTNTVRGLWNWVGTGTTTERPRVASMSKNFVKQADDWAQWRTTIYSELENGDTYTDTSRNGTSYMYFTQDELNGITLTIDNIAIDPSLYEIVPADTGTDGKYSSYKITFKGTVSVTENGETVKPSKEHPLVISYTTKMVNPSSGKRTYYNDAVLTAGIIKDTDYDYCVRNNTTEIRKSVHTSSNGIITWFVQANYYGYSGQPDGTCIVTDTLPAGTEFISASKYNGSGSLEVQSATKNDDGTTTLKLKLSGLLHDEVSKTHPSDNNSGYEFRFLIKTKITDEDYLFGTESKDFYFTNNISLYDRYGNFKQASASANIYHSAMKKTMTYNETTAPYAKFSIELNKDKVDLDPDSNMVSVVDVSSDSLAVDPKSIEVVNANTGDELPFEIDASKMFENKLTVKVPDETYVKVTYNAQVLGVTGQMVQVGNTAYFEGHERTQGTNTISETVQVLKATGLAVSEPMIWLSKRDESANALGNALFDLYSYDQKNGWSLIQSGIASTGNAQTKGTKVESLNLATLYKLVEASAPEGYVLNSNPYYFVLYDDSQDSPTSITFPDGVSASKVFQGPSGSVIAAYNQPYTTVKFAKMSDDGVQLTGAQLEVHKEDGSIATDNQGNPVTMTSSATGANEFVLAPGKYTLVETAAPEGYETAEEVPFIVSGNSEHTVLQNDQPVSVVTLSDASSITSLTIHKNWLDADNVFLSRPERATVQLYADNQPVQDETAVLTPEGPDAILGTVDDWTVTFDGLNVMKEGKKVAYSVKEIDVSPDYEPSYSIDNEDGTQITVTNTLVTPPTSIPVVKHWANDSTTNTRPQSITVHLFANGENTGKSIEITANGPDNTPNTEDDWTGEFNDIALLDKGNLINYTLREDTPQGYKLINTPENNNEEATESDGSSDTAETPDGTNIDTGADSSDAPDVSNDDDLSGTTAPSKETPNTSVSSSTYTVDPKTAQYIDEVPLGDDGFELTNMYAPEPTPDSSDGSSNESNNADKKTSELSKTNDLLPVWLLPLLGIMATSALILTISLRKKH